MLPTSHSLSLHKMLMTWNTLKNYKQTSFAAIGISKTEFYYVSIQTNR